MELCPLPNVLQPKISTAVLARISQYKHYGEDLDKISKLWSLSKLDARSDPATLSVTRDGIRQIYRDAVGGSPMGMITTLNPDHQIFLLADEEVLQDPDLSLLKVVQADYAPDEYKDDGPQRYYGWMTMDPGSLIYLWAELEEVDSGLSDLISSESPGAFGEPE
jgi:hypothetical protein